MKRTTGIATLLLASAATGSAYADTLNWSAPNIQYNTAAQKPVVAMGATQYGEWAVEVQQTQSGFSPLAYSSGRAIGTGKAPIGLAHNYDVGFAPAIAPYNTDPNAPAVIEVHQGGTGFGSLWFHIGTMTNIFTPSVLSWSAPTQFDNGFAPAVGSLEGYVVEVHQGQTGMGSLWYHFGSTSGSTFTWESTPAQYDVGMHPAVAITRTPLLGLVAVEVHQGGNGFGPLWYRTGLVQAHGIAWNNASQYDNGVAPSIAVDGDRVFEVHQGTTGVGPLWYKTGVINDTGIAWNTNGYQYDTGFAPAIGWSPASSEGIEVHQATSGLGGVKAHAYRTTPDVPVYAQAESNWCWLTTGEMIVDAIHGVAGTEQSPQVPESMNECAEANTRQRNEIAGGSAGWGGSKQFIDCCNPGPTWSDSRGCNRPGDTANTLRDHGFTFSSASTASYATLTNETNAGRPVAFGVGWNAPQTGGHSMVVTGTITDSHGAQWVLVNDPSPVGGQELWPYAAWSNTNPNQYGATISSVYYGIKAH